MRSSQGILMSRYTFEYVKLLGWIVLIESNNHNLMEEGIKSPILSNLHFTSLSQNGLKRTTVALWLFTVNQYNWDDLQPIFRTDRQNWGKWPPIRSQHLCPRTSQQSQLSNYTANVDTNFLGVGIWSINHVVSKLPRPSTRNNESARVSRPPYALTIHTYGSTRRLLYRIQLTHIERSSLWYFIRLTLELGLEIIRRVGFLTED